MSIKNMSISNHLNDTAVFILGITSITVANINILVGIFTAIAGLAIQLYFKVEQNRRERERHEWEKKENEDKHKKK